jgi:hypothetical protein
MLALPASADAATRCKVPAGGAVELRTPRIVVYDDPRAEHPVACYLETGLRKELAFIDGRNAHYILRVAGPYVAFSYDESFGADMAYVGIEVFDMKRDRERTVASGDAFRGDGYYDAVLKPSGAIAWTEGNAVRACTPKCDVANARTIATGGDIEKRSLEETRDGVRWRQGGRWRSAPLR